MTDAEFIAWLKSPARVPCVLVEAVALVDGVETTRYLSNTGYTTSPTDTPASTHYLGSIVGGARITEQLSLDGIGANMAFGDIELDNSDGNLDDWLADVWANRQVRMYVGDMRWDRADFRLVFDGVTADIGSRSRDLLNLTVRDKLQRLNTAVTETKLGGTSVNSDRLLPVCLGEAHNVTPLLIDQALLKYQVHNGPIERIIEVRDNGVVVAYTADLTAGTFTLSASPAGLITCSVQGAKLSDVYVNTAAKLVELLATEYGTDPFVPGDLDADNLSEFDAANPQPLGVYLAERENVLTLCQQIAASVGAQVVMSAAGTLRLIKQAAPVAGTEVTAANMAERTLRVADRIPVVAAAKVGYCRNWTVQTSLQTGIPAEHKDIFAQEWLTATATNSTVATDYKLTLEPQQQNTLMQVREDARTEAARRLALWREPRTVFSYDGMPELLLEELGGFQTITHDRYGLSDGTDVQVIGVERDWLSVRAAFSVIAGGALPGSGDDVITDDPGVGGGPENIGVSWVNRVVFGDTRIYYFYRGSYEGVIVRSLTAPYALYRHHIYTEEEWPVDSEGYSASEYENTALVASGGLTFDVIDLNLGSKTSYTLTPPVGADSDLGVNIFGHCYLNGKYIFATKGASAVDRVGLWIVDPSDPSTVEAAYAANTGTGTAALVMRPPPGGTGSSVYILTASRVTKHAIASATAVVNLGAASGGSAMDVDPNTGNIWTVNLSLGNLTVTVHSPSTGLIDTHGPTASSFGGLTEPQPLTFTPSDGVYVTGEVSPATDYFHKFSSDGLTDHGSFIGGYHGSNDREAILHNPVETELLAFRRNGYVSIGAPADITTVNFLVSGTFDQEPDNWYIAEP
jgi:hypothetical protein